MKNELLVQLRELLSAEDIMSVREGVRDIRNNWKAESVKERQQQLEAFKAIPENENAEFVYTPSELEGEFQELLKQYEDRIQEHGKKLAAERQKNLEQKLTLLQEFEVLVRAEENIGKAFSDHKSIRERWDAIGDVPGDKFHELLERFHRLNQEFFYKINIYKELQAHDLKVNLRKKEEMIEEAKKLEAVSTINDLEVLIRKLHREWMNIGPSPRENFKELGDTFFGLLREAQNRVQAHYDELHAHSEENLNRKKSLVNRMKEILAMELTNHATWNRWTDEVLKLQEEWRTIGWARKKENEDVWQEFRGLCDHFFSRRKEHFEQRRNSFKENRDKKESLIEKAKSFQDSTDWKATTEALKKLQEQWKSAGSADPRDEQKLWQRFRSACDLFFQRKKEHFGEVAGQQDVNYTQKIALIEEVEQTSLTGNRAEDLALLKQFSERWHAIGFVPREKVKEVMDRFNAALDVKYGQLNAAREQQEMGAFRNRLQNIRSSGSGDQGVRRERSILREKIDRLIGEIKQYENNMGFFTGKGAEAMRKEIEKKISAARREIDDLKKKLQMIDAE